MAEKPTPAPAPAPRPTPPLKKPSPAPPLPTLPLKPPPSQNRPVHFRPQKQRYRHRRGFRGRRLCCLAASALLAALCLALAAACLAYLYFHPRLPSFHLQPLAPTRFRIGNSTEAPAVDAAFAVKIVSWNPNDKIAFDYGGGDGSVSIDDADGDIAVGGEAAVGGFEQAPKSVTTLGFVAAARGVVVDEAVAVRLRERYRRRHLAFKVVVDTTVGARAGGARTGKVPVRVFCEAAMAARGGGGAGMVGPMSNCQLYLFRVRWFNLN